MHFWVPFWLQWAKIVFRACSVRRDGKWPILWSCGRGCSGSRARELPPGKGGGTFLHYYLALDQRQFLSHKAHGTLVLVGNAAALTVRNGCFTARARCGKFRCGMAHHLFFLVCLLFIIFLFVAFVNMFSNAWPCASSIWLSPHCQVGAG